MKARNMLQLLVVVVILAVPVAGAAFSDSGDAAAPTYGKYYYDQLTPNQKAIYDALEQLDPASVSKQTVYGLATPDYVVQVTVGSGYYLALSSYDLLKDAVLYDMSRAWQASLLDNPMAWWGWSGDNAYDILFYSVFSITGAPTSVSGFTFYVDIADTYMTDGTTMAQKVDAVKTALSDLKSSGTITGTTVTEKIRSINSYLCSSSFGYENVTYSNNVYGAFVAKDSSNVHKLVCSGYSQAFRAICDMYDIPCINVVGMSSQKDNDDAHMWNIVYVNAEIDGVTKDYYLGVDTTWNATSGSKEAFLLSGRYTDDKGVTFSQSHHAFEPVKASENWVEYVFTAPTMNDKGFAYPQQADILSVITEYAPWALIGIVCVILAYVLWNMARRGE